MGKRAFLSEFDTAQIFRRLASVTGENKYDAATVMGLLREVAKCNNERPDWNLLARKLNAGISSARECQALWRHIAYRKELAEFYADDEQPSDDESDLEFEVLPSPAVSSETNSEVVRWVKKDMQRFHIRVGKKKRESKSKNRDAGLLGDSNQGLSGNGRDGGKNAPNGNGDSSAGSPPSGTAGLANPECTLSRAALGGQSERKKRKLWSAEEDHELISAVEKFGEGNWTNILKGSFTHERTAAQLSQRWALIRKRKEAVQAVEAYANRLPSTPSAEQGNGVQTPHADQSRPASPAQKGNPAQDGSPEQNGTSPGDNGGNLARTASVVPPTTTFENGCIDEAVPLPSIAMASIPLSSGACQDHITSPPNASPMKGVNGTSNGSIATSGSMDNISLKGGIGTSTQTNTNGAQQQDSTGVAGGAARSTAGSSATMATVVVGLASSASAKNVNAPSVGPGRLIAPGVVVTSAAAASVVASETRQAVTLPSTGTPTSGTTKYVVRSNGRGASTKELTGPDPGVQAAAVAAGARITPASTLLKAAHSGNVVHIRPRGLPVTKSGLPTQMGNNASGGSRGTSGAIVHYITTQRPAQQTKNQATKANGSSQTS